MTLGELETARRAGTPFVLCVFNNAASGYVKALQHSMFGAGNYQSSDLVEMDYAAITRAMGCKGIRVEDPAQLAPALREGLENTATPTVLDIVVTRDPAKMLPGVDNRTLAVQQGRPAGVSGVAGSTICPDIVGQGRSMGAALLRDALRRVLAASDIVGLRAVWCMPRMMPPRDSMSISISNRHRSIPCISSFS